MDYSASFIINSIITINIINRGGTLDMHFEIIKGFTKIPRKNEEDNLK